MPGEIWLADHPLQKCKPVGTSLGAHAHKYSVLTPRLSVNRSDGRWDSALPAADRSMAEEFAKQWRKSHEAVLGGLEKVGLC